MAKKMSVEEILAAAKAGGAKKPAEPAAPAPAAAAPDVEPVAAEAAPAAPAPKAAVKAGSMSAADILAMAKAGKKPAAPAAPAPVAAAAPVAEKPKPAPPKTDAAVAAAVPKDTASVLAAARKAAKPGPVSKAEAEAKGIAPVVPAGKKKLEAPPMPAKPAFARPAAAADPDRRTFMAAAAGALFGSSLAIGFTSLAVTHLMWVLGLARYMFPNILIEPPTRFKVGPPTNFGPGQVETKFIPEFGVWIVRYEFDGKPMIFALKAVCTHLGCTPNWLEAEQKFKCPCHGSGFYKDGINFEGPAPRPLERYAISLADDGQLEVDKSRTFNQEQGQWKDAASFVSV
ncbi:Cytochrome b6-f complex iron-sulfur subunit [Anatilimnocola aggregata]|uniref:Cytochrome b6-f complex iron-sulfur subunit n=1 Tax=Anatilimnocola aggregata TaxID=2528021 RepID=A0A517YN28_9BACT|nr:ubiquinol-cytochrome c reductase iron-sulfur subunit [Anatilimnocola aggregata]QDU31625.1 Cytochrome b6-f complex iron-sulfur subunit [Anatilimnocola aggregata]